MVGGPWYSIVGFIEFRVLEILKSRSLDSCESSPQVRGLHVEGGMGAFVSDDVFFLQQWFIIGYGL